MLGSKYLLRAPFSTTEVEASVKISVQVEECSCGRNYF